MSLDTTKELSLLVELWEKTKNVSGGHLEIWTRLGQYIEHRMDEVLPPDFPLEKDPPSDAHQQVAASFKPADTTPAKKYDLADLYGLPWMEGKYGPWVPADKAPQWAKDLIQTKGDKSDKGSRLHDIARGLTYTCSTKGNLAKYEDSKQGGRQ